MQVDAPGADSRACARVDRVDGVARRPAERVAAGVAHRPEAEGEAVLGSRGQGIVHGGHGREPIADLATGRNNRSSCVRSSVWTSGGGIWGVKALAVSEEDGAIVGRLRDRLPTLHTASGMVGAGPGRLVARHAGGARGARRRRRGGRRRPERRGAVRPGRARRRGGGDPPGDPVERRQDGGGVRRDQGAGQAGAPARLPATARSPGSPRRSCSGCASTSPTRTGGSRTFCCPRTTCGCA